MPNRLKMLVAEDEETDVFLLRRAFERAGVAVNPMFVRDGQETLDYLEGLGEFSDRGKYPLPSVIVLDIKMPRMNGFDVLAWLKSHKNYRCTPVIMFSGSDDLMDIDRAYELGANVYMTKPNEAEQLLRLVGVLKEYWARYVKLPAARN